MSSRAVTLKHIQGYAIETTRVNLLDWATARGFAFGRDALADLGVPVLLLVGGNSHPAMRRIIARLGSAMPEARTEAIEGASHFMIVTHAAEAAARLRRHVARAAWR